MPQLRWTLLLLGVLFLAGLAWWEWRKPRQANSNRPAHDPATPEPPTRVLREPTLTLPEMRARDPMGSSHPLPVVDVNEDESLMGLRIDGEPVEQEVALAEAMEGAAPLLEPIIPSPPLPDPPVLEEGAGDGVDDRSSAATYAPPLPELPKPSEPIVEWPPEEARRIVALRIVSVTPERFAGRAVRTALVAEGFMLGKYSIYHKPDAAHRSVLSAASLSKPGTFDAETIDTQRFTGLSLFAVLPGPKSPREAFEELLATARNLNERLQGGLQDERGGPLTPTRIASLREGMGSVVAAGQP